MTTDRKDDKRLRFKKKKGTPPMPLQSDLHYTASGSVCLRTHKYDNFYHKGKVERMVLRILHEDAPDFGDAQIVK